MSLLRAHKSVFEVVRDALAADSTFSHIKVSVGARFQGEQNPEVIIQQSSFDINDLNTADYGSFEISIFCYSNTYTEAAKIADTVFNAIQANNQYTLTEQELIVGSEPEQYNISQTLYHLKGLDLFLEHYDEDGYEANVLVRATEAEATTTGVGDYIERTSGSPAPFYAQLDSRIQDLSDVNVSTLREGEILKYDVSEGEWVNAPLPLLVSSGINQSDVNGYTVLSLADSQSFTSASTSGDLTVGGDLYFAGAQTKLIRPLNTGQAAGPLTIQSNGDLVIELDENDDETDKALIVKNGADTEVFKVDESGEVRVNSAYTLPTSDGTNGQIMQTDGTGSVSFVDFTSTSSIDDLSDVDTSTAAPTDGQALVWNNTNSEWEPGDVDIPGFTSTAVDTNDMREWFADASQIIGVGSYNTSGTEIASGEGHPRDLFFKPDGTRLFFVGNGLDDIQSVDLPTAWDLSSIPSTATVTSVNLAGSAAVGGRGFEGTLYGMYVASDPNDTATYGKKFFVVGDSQDEVQEYTCTTAWDLSTMSTDATAVFDLRTDHGNSVYEIEFKPDGSIMYVTRAGNPNTVSHYDLSTNWDLSTATYNSSKSVSLTVASTSYGNPDSYLIGLEFNDDGTRAWVSGRTRHNLHQLTLSTAWDLSTYTDDQIPLNLGGGYIEKAFGVQYPNFGEQNFQWPSGLFNTDDYFYILFNTNDQIIRLDKKYNETQIRDRIDNKVVFQNGFRANANVEVAGFVSCERIQSGGNAYFSGAMNWSGFNSGPAVTKGNTFILGNTMRTIHFTDSGNPAALSGPTAHDISNTNPGTFIMVTDNSTANNIILPANSGTVLLDTTPNLYFNAFDTEAASKVTGATEVVEYYYTARADGQGAKEAFKHDIPAYGQTISRKVYYANKAFANPDTAADWTLDTSHTSYSDATTAAKALLNSASTGTPPLTTKVATTGLSTVDWFTLTSGDMTIGYSLRLLNPYYTGAAIRVINDSNVEADIGFVEEELDTTALLNHCGSGDGYLVKWYDQSQTGGTGSGNDATYGSPHFTPVNRPKIVSAGSVLTENGKPCIFVEDSSMQLASQVDFPNTNGTLVAYVSSKNASADNNSGMILGDYQGYANQQNRIWEHGTYIQSQIYNGTGNHTFASPEDGAIAGSGQHVVMLYRDPSARWYMDKNSVNSGQNQNRNYTFSIETLFGAHNSVAYSYYGNVQEIIAFDSGKSTERADIKSNINAYYSIY